MIGSLLRVLFGFLLACLVAGITQVTFALTPQGILGSGDGPMIAAFEWILLTATHAAVFSAPFALVAAAIGEWLSVRSAFYYVTAGLIVALVGFLAQYQGETIGDPTIVNTYAMLAYAVTGAVAGLTYWLLAGRRAGEDPVPNGSEPTTSVSSSPPLPPRKPIEVAGAPRPTVPPPPVAPAKPAVAGSVPSTPPPGTKA